MIRSHPAAFDPWALLAAQWPEIEVVVEPMAGRLLGQLRYPVIALRAGSSAAQHRCTLTHELVHLERGLSDCGPWATREEALVEAESARRLITADALHQALLELGCRPGLAGLAASLHVDTLTLRTRLAGLTRPRPRSSTGARPMISGGSREPVVHRPGITA